MEGSRLIRKLESDDFAKAIILVAVLGFGIVVGAISDSWDLTLKWLGALSGWMAACVGGLTVWVIWRQINANHEDNQRVANETREILNEHLSDILREINLGWRLLDFSDDGGLPNSERRSAYRQARSYLHNSLGGTRLDYCDGLLPALRPLDHALCSSVIRTLRQIAAILAPVNISRIEDLPDDHEVEHQRFEQGAARLGIHLSHLEKTVSKYDVTLAAIFEGRRKFNVNHDPLHKHAEPLVLRQIEEWEAIKAQN